MYVITIHFEKSHPKTFIAIHINYTTTNNDHFEKKCYRETLEERDMDIHATNTNISTAANTTTILPDDEDDDEHLWEHETATLNPNTPMHDPDRLLMYNKANYDDDYDDENDDAEEEDFHAKSHSLYATGAAVVFAVGGMGYMAHKLIMDDDDEVDDAAAIVEHSGGNLPGPQDGGQTTTTTTTATSAPQPPSSQPPPPTQALQQMACQAAANAAGSAGAGASAAAGAVAVGVGVAAA
jgi:hypothetical protein